MSVIGPSTRADPVETTADVTKVTAGRSESRAVVTKVTAGRSETRADVTKVTGTADGEKEDKGGGTYDDEESKSGGADDEESKDGETDNGKESKSSGTDNSVESESSGGSDGGSGGGKNTGVIAAAVIGSVALIGIILGAFVLGKRLACRAASQDEQGGGGNEGISPAEMADERPWGALLAAVEGTFGGGKGAPELQGQGPLSEVEALSHEPAVREVSRGAYGGQGGVHELAGGACNPLNDYIK